jgi:hypothetical protein
MRIINTIAALLLAAATTLLSLFYLGSQEQHDEAMAQHFWGELSLRFVFYSIIGLVGAGLWWGANYGLVKSGLVQHVNLRQTALLLTIGAVSGALAGALLFCLS